MKWIMLLLSIGCVIIIIAVVTMRSKRRAITPQLPYVSKQSLLTAAELSFYHVLRRCIGDQFTIFCQVRVADLLSVRQGLTKSERQPFFNKIRSKHVDFVLCNPNDLSIIAAIELDDKSHKRPDRIKRDAFLNDAFAVAKIPLIRMKTKSAYSNSDVMDPIRAALAGVITQTQKINNQHDQLSEHHAESAQQSMPTCPNCSEPMVRKKSNRGKYAGSYFMACSAYPKCKTIMPDKDVGQYS